MSVIRVCLGVYVCDRGSKQLLSGGHVCVRETVRLAAVNGVNCYDEPPQLQQQEMWWSCCLPAAVDLSVFLKLPGCLFVRAHLFPCLPALSLGLSAS